MENDETIISKGDPYGAMIMNIVQTHKIFMEKMKEENAHTYTVGMLTYCKDVGFLLNMLDRAGEKLANLRKESEKRIIT